MVSTADSTGQREVGQRLVLAVLGFGALVVGTAELLVVGVLDLVGNDLHVSIGTAGSLVTAYALGISIGGPLLTAATIRLSRKTLLVVALTLYVAGNLVAAGAANFGMLLAARIATGALHGLFIGLAFALAATLVPDAERGRAMAVVIGGITAAMIIGVPLGTLIGHALGWRAAFVAVSVLGAGAVVAAVALVPPVQVRAAASVREQAGDALAPRVLAMLGVAFMLLGAEFSAFTYLAPYLQGVTGISAGAVSGFLLVFGLAAAVGTYLGGRAADRDASFTLVLAASLLAAIFGLVYLVGGTPLPAGLLLVAWGVTGLGLVPALQLRIVSLGGRGGDLAATFGASAVNAGIAAGSLVGGRVVAHAGVHAVMLAAFFVSLLAVPATWAVRRSSTPARPRGLAATVERQTLAEEG